MNALFGLAVLVLWPLVQVPLLLYLARRAEFEDDDGPDPEAYIPTAVDDGGGDGPGGRAGVGTAGDGPEDVTLCHRCGAENRPAYDYCQNCVARLAMDGPYSAPA